MTTDTEKIEATSPVDDNEVDPSMLDVEPDEDEGPVEYEEDDPLLLEDDQVREIEQLKEEFGDGASEIVIDVALVPSVREFLLRAEDSLKESMASLKGKASYCIHREPGPREEYYLLRTIRPDEWDSNWLSMLTNDRAMFDMYGPALLETCMVYPKYEDVAWNWEESKEYSPDILTKPRLISKFFELVLPDPKYPTSVSFKQADVDTAIKVAKRKSKPGL